MAEGPPPAPLDATRLNLELDSLRGEVLRLQRKLGEFHGSDLNAVRRAYASLCQHVAALEEEARGMAAELAAFETQPIPPELVAQELGVAAAVAFGVALLHQTVKALPLKAHTGAMIGKGLWLLGGACVLARLTGGTLAHLASMLGRNAGRKRRLQRQLEAVEERIGIMAALQQWAERQQEAAAPGAAPTGAPSTGQQAAAEAALAVPPPRRVSPATSSGSSAELVDMPQAEELEAAEAGAGAAAGGGGGGGGSADTSAAAAGSAAAAAGAQQQEGRRAGAPSGVGGLQFLRAYAELGKK